VAGAVNYDIQICTDAACLNILPAPISATAVVPTDYTVVGSLSPGTYYWRVRTNGASLHSAYSASRAFIVREDILTAPANGSATTNVRPTFTWSAITYSSTLPTVPLKYRLQVFNSVPTLVLEKTNLTATSYMMVAADAALAFGPHLWHVNLSDDGGANYDDFTSVSRTVIVSPPLPVAPVLATPATGVTLVSSAAPTFNWGDVALPPNTTSLTYDFQYATNTTFTANVITLNNASSDITLGAAPAAGTYYWRARAVNNFGAPGAFSASRTFIIRSTPPALTAPAINAVINTSKPPFSWPTFGVGATYHIQIDNENTFAPPIPVDIDDIATLTFTPANSLSQGDWFWRITATDALGHDSAPSDARKFTLVISSAPANNLVYTLVGAATTYNVPFSWVTVPGATGYTLRVSPNLDMSGATDYAPTVPPLGLSRTVPLAAGEWYWYVTPTGGAAVIPPPQASIVRKVTVSPSAPAAPTLLSPPTGTPTNLTAVLPLDWSDVSPPVGSSWALGHYELQLATNATFTANLQSINTGTTSNHDIAAMGDGTYYWRVRAISTLNAPAAFSAARTFIVDTAPPAMPTQNAPADNSSSTNKMPMFSWSVPTGATHYQLHYGTNFPGTYVPNTCFEMTTTGTVTIPVTAASYPQPSPLSPNTYYWQVRALDAAGNASCWTNLRTFKINSLLTDAPLPNRFGPGDPILLTWGPLSWVTNGAGWYEVQIDNNSNFLTPEFQRVGNPATTGNGINQAEYTTSNNFGVVIPAGSLPTGLPNGTWYWRVRGFNPTVLPSGAYGAYSTTGTFTVEK
jgi:hypothetical protein